MTAEGPLGAVLKIFGFQDLWELSNRSRVADALSARAGVVDGVEGVPLVVSATSYDVWIPRYGRKRLGADFPVLGPFGCLRILPATLAHFLLES